MKMAQSSVCAGPVQSDLMTKSYSGLLVCVCVANFACTVASVHNRETHLFHRRRPVVFEAEAVEEVDEDGPQQLGAGPVQPHKEVHVVGVDQPARAEGHHQELRLKLKLMLKLTLKLPSREGVGEQAIDVDVKVHSFRLLSFARSATSSKQNSCRSLSL
jgi:hypothetical protein